MEVAGRVSIGRGHAYIHLAPVRSQQTWQPRPTREQVQRRILEGQLTVAADASSLELYAGLHPGSLEPASWYQWWMERAGRWPPSRHAGKTEERLCCAAIGLLAAPAGTCSEQAPEAGSAKDSSSSESEEGSRKRKRSSSSIFFLKFQHQEKQAAKCNSKAHSGCCRIGRRHRIPAGARRRKSEVGCTLHCVGSGKPGPQISFGDLMQRSPWRRAFGTGLVSPKIVLASCFWRRNSFSPDNRPCVICVSQKCRSFASCVRLSFLACNHSKKSHSKFQVKFPLTTQIILLACWWHHLKQSVCSGFLALPFFALCHVWRFDGCGDCRGWS